MGKSFGDCGFTAPVRQLAGVFFVFVIEFAKRA
jgi:hypothetical protein